MVIVVLITDINPIDFYEVIKTERPSTDSHIGDYAKNTAKKVKYSTNK